MPLYEAQKQLVLNGLLEKVTFKLEKFWIKIQNNLCYESVCASEVTDLSKDAVSHYQSILRSPNSLENHKDRRKRSS